MTIFNLVKDSFNTASKNIGLQLNELELPANGLDRPTLFEIPFDVDPSEGISVRLVRWLEVEIHKFHVFVSRDVDVRGTLTSSLDKVDLTPENAFGVILPAADYGHHIVVMPKTASFYIWPTFSWGQSPGNILVPASIYIDAAKSFVIHGLDNLKLLLTPKDLINLKVISNDLIKLH